MLNNVFKAMLYMAYIGVENLVIQYHFQSRTHITLQDYIIATWFLNTNQLVLTTFNI